MKKFDSEVSYIEGVVFSKDFQKMSSQEQVEYLKTALEKKLNEVYSNGILRGEANIKSQLEKINFTK